LKSEAARLLTVSRSANFGAEKKAIVTKRMNVYTFLAETADAFAKERAKDLPTALDSTLEPLASVALADLAAFFAKALEAVGGNIDSNVSHGLRFNLMTQHRAVTTPAPAVSLDGPTWDTYYADSRLTQAQVEAGWGFLTGHGGSFDLEELASTAVKVEVELRAAKSSTVAKTKTNKTKKVNVEAKLKVKKRAEDDKKAKEASMPTQSTMQTVTSEMAQGPDWDNLVQLLAPHAKALGGLDGVSSGSCVNAALLHALATEELTSVSAVVAASDEVLRKLPSFTGIRAKKLRSICAAAVAEAEEDLRIKNLHKIKVKPTTTSKKTVATKDKKAPANATHPQAQAEDTTATVRAEVNKRSGSSGDNKSKEVVVEKTHVDSHIEMPDTSISSKAAAYIDEEKLELQGNAPTPASKTTSLSHAASEPRAFTPPGIRDGTPTKMTGHDRSARTNSKSNLIGGRLSASPSLNRIERGANVSANRSEARLSEARRERFAESPLKESVQPTPQLLTKPSGSNLLAAMGSFNSSSSSRGGANAPSTMMPQRQIAVHKEEAELGDIITAPRTSVSLGRLSSESFVAAAGTISSARHLAMGIGDDTARNSIGSGVPRSKGQSRELSEGSIGSAF